MTRRLLSLTLGLALLSATGCALTPGLGATHDALVDAVTVPEQDTLRELLQRAVARQVLPLPERPGRAGRGREPIRDPRRSVLTLEVAPGRRPSDEGVHGPQGIQEELMTLMLREALALGFVLVLVSFAGLLWLD